MSLLKDLEIKGRVLFNEPLCRHTTLRIGGPAAVWAEPRDIDELASVFTTARRDAMPILVIGGGSNLLVSDQRLPLIAVSLKGAFGNCEADEEAVVVGAGCPLQKFILRAIGEGYAGLEFMAGIPGTVGGAIWMNAGAGLQGPWISDFLKGVEVLDANATLRYREAKEIGFGYRRSGLSGCVIVQAEFRLKRAAAAGRTDIYKKFLDEKRRTQDLTSHSAGCIFKNPPDSGLSAAQLIDGCGLKGARVGDAMVSRIHANFIVNVKNATFVDATNLIEMVRDTVARERGIRLETEVEIIR